jgi:DNA primase large subunit
LFVVGGRASEHEERLTSLTRNRSCQQILTGTQPGAQDSHGCPYRHFAPEQLQQLLVEAYPVIQVGSLELREVMDSVKKTHYHVACTRVFELTHPGNVKKGEGIGGGNMVNHPNEYYNKSLEYEK